MYNYNSSQTANFKNETFAYLIAEEKENTLFITLNRPEKKNALNPTLFNEIAFALCYAHFEKSIWNIVIQANGNIFCAGADLKAFAGEIDENNSTIPAPNGEVLLGDIFQKIHKPCIAKITGDAYAGGIFFLAGCHYVLALENLKFGLSEVKRGLFPFQVMGALLKVMPERKVLDWCMMGSVISTQQAFEYGLITHICTFDNIESTLNNLLYNLKENAPSAIRLGLEALDNLYKNNTAEQLYLKSLLANTLNTQDAKEGILAFKEKRKPNWTGE